MRILYIHQYFATPRGTTGTRSYEFARRWVEGGHSVIMLTTVAQLCEQDLCDSTGRFIKRVMIDGIDVRAVNLPYNQKMGFIGRSLSFIGFVLAASIYVLFVKRPDVIYATSTPLTIGIPALAAKWFRRIRFVFEVRDQWPRVPIELGVIKNNVLKKILLWLEKVIYENSCAIVALSVGMTEGVRSVIGSSKHIVTVPNCSDTELFRPDIDGGSIRSKYGWGDKFVLLHFGAMGNANGLEFVVDAAEKLKGSEEIHFVIIGDGNTRAALMKRAEELGLKNIEFLGGRSKSELPEYVAACDVSIVIFADYPVLEHNSANKFFDSLSSGKPVLLNYSGWQREVIEEVNAGLGCRQCDLDEFTIKVRDLNLHREGLAEMGRNGRKLAEKEFNRDMLAAKVLKVLEDVVCG